MGFLNFVEGFKVSLVHPADGDGNVSNCERKQIARKPPCGGFGGVNPKP